MNDSGNTYSELLVGNRDSQARGLEHKYKRYQSSDRNHCEKSVGGGAGGGSEASNE